MHEHATTAMGGRDTLAHARAHFQRVRQPQRTRSPPRLAMHSRCPPARWPFNLARSGAPVQHACTCACVPGSAGMTGACARRTVLPDRAALTVPSATPPLPNVLVAFGVPVSAVPVWLVLSKVPDVPIPSAPDVVAFARHATFVVVANVLGPVSPRVHALAELCAVLPASYVDVACAPGVIHT